MLAVIRIRGPSKVKKEINYNLELLRLHKANHLSLVPEKKEFMGMLKKAEGYITWGKIDKNVLAKLLKKRGRIKRNQRLTIEYLKKKKINSFEELTEIIMEGKAKLLDYEIKPVFRLNPPSKGFERAGIKKHFNVGGAFGDRKEKINDLIEKMM